MPSLQNYPGKSEISRTRTELEILYRLSRILAQRHEIKVLLNEVLDIMENEMGMLRGTLTLRRPDSDVFSIMASRGLTTGEAQKGHYSLGEGITGRVAASGRPALIPDITRESEFLNRTGGRPSSQPHAFLCVPIVHRQQVIGTMSIDRAGAEDADSLERDLTFLKLVAGLLAESVAAIREQQAERDSLLEENRRLVKQLGDRFNPSNIIGNSKSMRRVYEQIAQVAASPATVLIRGESGTGKELVAKAIHYSSDRRNLPLISVNCAALPENLIESELFGHEKGAFTGAVQQRKGRFELAHGGTLFLDEIGDIAPGIQVRLLRVLQEKRFERVGGTAGLQSDVRIVAATSRDLEAQMRAGNFREDLFYRLDVFPIHLPPLRERRSDIILLADHFVETCNRKYSKNVRRISTTAINMMNAYHWPGNVRELENCIERAMLTTTDDVIHGFNLPPSLQTAEDSGTVLVHRHGQTLKDMVRAYEHELITDALKQHRGNIAAAARDLNTTVRIIAYRIQKLGIDRQSFKA